MDIYYINYDGINCSVFYSQIYTYCHLLSKNNLKVTLLNCERNISSVKYPDKNKGLYHDKLYVTAAYKNRYFDFVINKKLVKETAELINEKSTFNEKIIIHCRGIFGSLVGLKVKRELKHYLDIKLISDFRGAVIDEYFLRHKNKGGIYKIILMFIIIKINRIQAFVCKKSDHIFCVSKKLEQYLKGRYTVNCRISVIPTCIDADKNGFDLEERIKIRKQMNTENKFVVVYCGGGQIYQKPEALVNAFINISKRIRNAVLLILTKDKNIFEVYLKKYNIEKSKYFIKSVPHSDVYKYLSSSDCAVLLRDMNNVNKVASPTKFAEYINCKLPVYISHSIGDIDEINRKYKVCIYEEDIENIKSKINEIKANMENFKLVVDNYYKWQNNIEKIIAIYNGL